MKTFLTIHQLLERLQLSRAMIYKLIANNGFPPPYKFGKASRWDEAEVEAWVIANRGAKS